MCFHVFFSDHTSFKCMSVCQRESIHAPISFGELCYSATHRPHSKSWRLKKKRIYKNVQSFQKTDKIGNCFGQAALLGREKEG